MACLRRVIDLSHIEPRIFRIRSLRNSITKKTFSTVAMLARTSVETVAVKGQTPPMPMMIVTVVDQEKAQIVAAIAKEVMKKQLLAAKVEARMQQDNRSKITTTCCKILILGRTALI